MSNSPSPATPAESPTAAVALCPELEATFWQLFRDFFDRAERKRRWSVTDDIPWDACNPALAPEIADVVETFCGVELYLPDYTSKILPKVRASRGRTWFYANWGYEELKHSLVLNDWLLKSRHRSDEQMTDMETAVFQHEWNLPHDNHLGMLCYAMVQEYATWLNYRNLRARAGELGGDPALEQLLLFLAVDEKAHYTFFRDCVKLYLRYDRPATLDQLRRVLNNFAMPAVHDLLDNSRRRIEKIRSLRIFDEDMYYREVVVPVLESLDVNRNELRRPRANAKT